MKKLKNIIYFMKMGVMKYEFSHRRKYKVIHGADMSCSMELRSARQVQKRKHKKKRINKKWAKRYGYITVFDDIKIRDCTLVKHNDCDIEFVITPEFIKY